MTKGAKETQDPDRENKREKGTSVDTETGAETGPGTGTMIDTVGDDREVEVLIGIADSQDW